MATTSSKEADAFPIRRIIRTIVATKSLGQLHDNWSSLALYLDTPDDRVKRIRDDRLANKMTLTDALHEIIEEWYTRCGSAATLDKLIRSFEDLDLNSIGEALRLEFNLPCKDSENSSLSWDGIGSNFRKKVDSSLETFYPSIKFDNEAKSKFARQELVDLMTGKEPSPIKNIIPESLKYYVERTLICRDRLTKKIFERSSDTFLFTGIERSHLSLLVSSNKSIYQRTDTTTNQLNNRDPDVKYMMLDMPNHFAKFQSSSSGSSVHHIKYEDNTFYWVKSTGSLESLRRFVGRKQVHLDESDFLQRMCSSSVPNLPVVISDTPGMGKSEILKQIAREVSTMLPERIIIFQEFPIFIHLVKQHSKDQKELKICIQAVLQELTCKYEKNELGRSILNSKLEAEAITIELLLDGYDELSAASVKTANDILKEIHSSLKSIRLWVTTRPHLLNNVENILTVFGYTIRSFTPGDQGNFLTSYWSRDQQLPIDRLSQYATNCLNQIKSTLSAKEQDIAGIPLQCRMIGEVYKEEATTYSKSEATFSGSKITIKSITDLYKLTIEKKLKKYQSTYRKFKLNDKKLTDMHVQLGLKLIFPTFFKTVKFKKVETEDVLNVVILESKGHDGYVKFIHRTFAEYFVSLFFVNGLCGKYVEDGLEDGSDSIGLSELHLKEVFACKITMRADEFKYTVICFFINSLLSWREVQQNICPLFMEIFKGKTYVKKLAAACVNGDLVNIFNLFDRFNIFKHYELDIFDEEFALRAIQKSSYELIKIIIDKLKRNNRFDINFRTKALRAAVERGEFSPVEFLLSDDNLQAIMKDGENWERMQILHCCVENSNENPDEIIRQKIDVIQLLVKMNPLILEEKDNRGNTPLLCETVHIRLLVKVIELGADVFARNNKNCTILHFMHFSPEEYHDLLTSLKKEIAVELVNAVDDEGHTPLEKLIIAMDPRKETLDVFKDAGAHFNNRSRHSSYPLLFDAIKYGRNVTTLRKLIQCGSDITWRGKDKRNLLHVASNYCNIHAIPVLVNHNVDISALDDNLDTPLHIGAQLKEFSGCLQIIKAVIECGGNATAQNKEGNTFLHELIRKHNITATDFDDLVQLLIQLNHLNVLQVDNNFGISSLVLALSTADVDQKTLSLLHERDIYLLKFTTGRIKKYVYEHRCGRGIEKFVCNPNFPETFTLGRRETSLYGVQIPQTLFARSRISRSPGCGCHLPNLQILEKAHVTFLHAASLHGNYKVIPFLLQIGLNVNERDSSSSMPLHYVYGCCKYDSNSGSKNCLNTIKILIENGADVYATVNGGDTFLHILLRESKYYMSSDQFHELAEYLVTKNRAKLFSIHGKNGVTALHLAVQIYHVKDETISFLHRSGVKFDSVDDDGDSVLMYAIRARKTRDFLKILISCGANAKQTNKMGQNLLHIASEYDNIEVVEFIISLGIDVNGTDTKGDTPLHSFVRYRSILAWTENSLNITKLLIENGATVTKLNKVNESPFSIAKWKFPYNTELLNLLSKRFAEEINNPDDNGNAQLHTTVSTSNFVFVKELVEMGAKVNLQNKRLETPLHIASSINDKTDAMKIVQLLIDSNANPFMKDENDYTFLHTLLPADSNLSPCQFHDLVEYLVDKGHGKSLETAGWKNGTTPIHLALFNIDVEGRTLTLLSSHVDWNLPDHLGRTPLFFLISGKHNSELAPQLVQQGADYKILDKSGNSFLHFAAECGNIAALKYFLSLKLNVNAANSYGNTPLHVALLLGQENMSEIITILAEAGAESHLKNKAGQTPFLLLLAHKNTPNQIQMATQTDASSNKYDTD